MSDDSDLKVAIDEMSRNLRLQFEAMDTHKTTARAILSAASLIIGLMGVLQLARPSIQTPFVSLYNLGIVLAMIVYVVLISLAVWSIMAVSMASPIKSDWETLKTYFVGKCGRDLLKMQLSAILNAIRFNDVLLTRQRRLVTAACVCLPVIVLILMALSLIPRG